MVPKLLHFLPAFPVKSGWGRTLTASKYEENTGCGCKPNLIQEKFNTVRRRDRVIKWRLSSESLLSHIHLLCGSKDVQHPCIALDRGSIWSLWISGMFHCVRCETQGWENKLLAREDYGHKIRSWWLFVGCLRAVLLDYCKGKLEACFSSCLCLLPSVGKPLLKGNIP